MLNQEQNQLQFRGHKTRGAALIREGEEQVGSLYRSNLPKSPTSRTASPIYIY
jgi:hypothetical protein